MRKKEGKRVVVGPCSVQVSRCGIYSQRVPLGPTATPETTALIAAALYDSIKQAVLHKLHRDHEAEMQRQEQLAALALEEYPDYRYPGPTMNHIARKPWEQAGPGEWTRWPTWLVTRVLRASRT